MRRILSGFYYGIGDLIAVLPVLQLLAQKKDIKLYVAVGEPLRDLENILEKKNITFIYFPLFSIKKASALIRFIRKIQKISPEFITISPHVADKSTSWKLPLLLSFLKYFNATKQIIGSSNERNAVLFTKQIPTDKTLSLLSREAHFFELIGLLESPTLFGMPQIFSLPQIVTKKNEIIIHPGASKSLKKWPLRYYSVLCEQLVKEYSDLHIRFLGLDSELKALQNIIVHKNISFESKSLEVAVKSLLHVKTAVVLDSAFAHICTALKIPTIALYGPTDPKLYAPQNTFINARYHNELDCQYCDALRCNQTDNVCMELITPQEVLENIRKYL